MPILPSPSGGSGADTIAGGTGNDTIVASAGVDQITAGGGADSVALDGAGADTGFQASGASVKYTAETMTAASMVAGETMTFGNGVDVYTGWTDNTDLFDTETAGLQGTLAAGADLENLAATEKNYLIRGAWNSTTKVFTQADAGADGLVIADAQNVDLFNSANDGNLFIVVGGGILPPVTSPNS